MIEFAILLLILILVTLGTLCAIAIIRLNDQQSQINEIRDITTSDLRLLEARINMTRGKSLLIELLDRDALH